MQAMQAVQRVLAQHLQSDPSQRVGCLRAVVYVHQAIYVNSII